MSGYNFTLCMDTLLLVGAAPPVMTYSNRHTHTLQECWFITQPGGRSRVRRTRTMMTVRELSEAIIICPHRTSHCI